METTTDSITSKDTYKILYTILIVVTIVAIGMFAINQAFGWYYKTELLYKPCDLCLKLNSNLTLTPIIKVDYFNLTYKP